MQLKGSKVVIVGGSSGIGLATARGALEAGASVVICGRSEERLRAASATLPDSVAIAPLDICSESEVVAFFSGFERLDHVFITAGGFPSKGNANEIQATSVLLPVMDSRVWGPVHVVRQAAPKIRPGGSITFTTGVATVKPLRGSAFLSATGGAIEILSRCLAVDMAPVRFNVIRPGLIDTPIHDRGMGEKKDEIMANVTAAFPVKRPGRPEEVADAALFLMRNEYVTGIELLVDGGFHLS